MEASRFDALTTSLAAGTGRRTALQVLAGSALGALGLARFGAAAAPPPRANGQPCDHSGQCGSDCCLNFTCRARRRCQAAWRRSL